VHLFGLIAQAETGDWRAPDAVLPQLRALLAHAGGHDVGAPGWQELAGQAVRIMPAWTSEAQLRLASQPTRLGAVIPREAAMLQPVLLVLSASAPHWRAALAFLDFALRRDTQEAVAAQLYLMPSSPQAVLPPSLAGRVPGHGTPGAPAAPLVLPDPQDWADARANLMARLGDDRSPRPVGRPAP
jgi:ABC-type Fe3+ transport system substrate-binding protein